MGTGNSSSSRLFSFTDDDPEHPTLPIFYNWVQFLVVWFPTNTNQAARLCYAYTDAVPLPEDWIEIARISAAPRSPGPGWPPGWSIRPDSTNEANNAATDFFNRVAAEKRDVYVGWQIYGDNGPMDIEECRLTFKKRTPLAPAA